MWISNLGKIISGQITSDIDKPDVTSVIDSQRTDIGKIVETRRAISTELRKALSGSPIDESKVISLSRQYGQYDGEISYFYATAFTQVGKTLTADQKEKLMSLRNLASYPCPGTSAYLYSEKINMPAVENTNFLFK